MGDNWMCLEKKGGSHLRGLHFSRWFQMNNHVLIMKYHGTGPAQAVLRVCREALELVSPQFIHSMDFTTFSF